MFQTGTKIYQEKTNEKGMHSVFSNLNEYLEVYIV